MTWNKHGYFNVTGSNTQKNRQSSVYVSGSDLDYNQY